MMFSVYQCYLHVGLEAQCENFLFILFVFPISEKIKESTAMPSGNGLGGLQAKVFHWLL